MFILISTVMFMSFYAEEREKGMFTRIVSSKIFIANYLLGHIIFTFFYVIYTNYTRFNYRKEYV